MEIEFNDCLYKTIVKLFQIRKNKPQTRFELIRLYMVLLNNVYSNIIGERIQYKHVHGEIEPHKQNLTGKQIITSTQLKTKINRGKTKYIIDNDLYNLYIAQVPYNP